MRRKFRLVAALWIVLIAMAFLPSLVLGYFWVSSDIRDFRHDAQSMRESYIQQRKNEVRENVLHTVDYIEYSRAQAEQRVKERIRGQVHHAVAVARHLYQNHKDELSKDEIIHRIAEALRPIRFQQGRGYFFAIDLDGINRLYAVAPQREGEDFSDMVDPNGVYLVREMLQRCKQDGEGFVRYSFAMPDQDGVHPKISYVYLFKPLDLMIGTGDYLDAMQEDIQQEVLGRIREMRFGQDGFVFIYDQGGTCLAHLRRDLIGTHRLEAVDAEGTPFVRNLQAAAAAPGGGFTRWIGSLRPSTGTPSSKMGYAIAIPDWGWTIGSGFFTDAVEHAVEARRAEMVGNIRRHLLFVLSLLLILAGVSFLLGQHVARRIGKDLDTFGTFFHKAATEETNIRLEDLHYREFAHLGETANDMIAHRRDAESKLRQTEERLRMFLSSLDDMVYFQGLDGNLKIFNQANERVTGFTQEEFEQNPQLWRSIVHPDDVRAAEKFFRDNPDGVDFFDVDYRLRNKQGQWRWIQSHMVAARNDTGEIIGYNCIDRDITERKQVETELFEQRTRLQLAVEAARAGTWSWDIASNITHWDARTCKIFGLDETEIETSEEIITRYILPEDLKAVKDNMTAALATETRVSEEYRIQRPDGDIRIVSSQATIHRDENGDPIRVVGMLTDVTERRQAEDALRQSEKRYRSVVNSMGEGLVVHRVNGTISTFNQKALDILGLTATELLSADWMHATENLFREDGSSCPPEEQPFLETLRTGSPVKNRVMGFLRKDGDMRWISVNTQPIVDFETNLPEAAVITFHDMTEQKHAEEDLSQFFRQSLLLVCIADMDGRLLRLNPAFVKLLAESDGELLGRSVLEFTHPEDQPGLRQAIQRLQKGQSLYNMRHRIRNRQGEYRLLEWTSSPDVERGRIYAFAQDITERQDMEDRLRQSQKMEAIGQLAGGVAHDFNNQLTGIMGYAELLSSTDDPELREYAQNIHRAGKRAAELTRQLLAYARKGRYQSVPVDLHQSIREVISILHHSIDKRIRIERHFRAEHSLTKGDPSQLENALLNLALNARDAMPAGGILTFSSENVILHHSDHRPEDIPPGEYIVLSVGDTGLGMDEMVRNRMFEPFFTTKAEGEGTGMGLAAVYGTVKNHRGAIVVYSQPGEGTTIRLFLPAEREHARKESHVAPPPPKSAVSGHILLIDDEDMVRNMTSRMLTRLGYNVSTAENGKEGTELYRRDPSRYDLVILDMVMPEMTGPDAFHAMRKIDPEVKVILSSGYSMTADIRAMIEEDVYAFLQKPFEFRQLASAIDNALKGRRTLPGEAEYSSTPHES